VLILLSSPARAEDGQRELRSAGAVALGWTVSTGLMVSLAAIPVLRCDRDLACLGTGLLSVGSVVLTHPFIAAGSVHLLADAAGDRQPYWHSLLGQAAGDVLAVSALVAAVAIARDPKPAEQPRMRALVFTSCALLSLIGPLIVRPLLDQPASRQSNMTQALLTF
jgi:hypothetical protein